MASFTLVFIGIINDKYGQIAFTQIVSAICSVLGNLWWAYYPSKDCIENGCSLIDTLPPVIMMGLGYGLMTGTTWNSIIYYVKGKRVGIAMGVASSILNVGLVLSPVVMGILKD